MESRFSGVTPTVSPKVTGSTVVYACIYSIAVDIHGNESRGPTPCATPLGSEGGRETKKPRHLVGYQPPNMDSVHFLIGPFAQRLATVSSLIAHMR